MTLFDYYSCFLFFALFTLPLSFSLALSLSLCVLLGKPFKRASLTWTADTPITRSQLEKQRETFWETAPTFEVYTHIYAIVMEALGTHRVE